MCQMSFESYDNTRFHFFLRAHDVTEKREYGKHSLEKHLMRTQPHTHVCAKPWERSLYDTRDGARRVGDT